MHTRLILFTGLAVLLLGGAFALAACGGDSGNDQPGAPDPATAEADGPADCAESFVAGADDTQRGIVNLSHAEGGEIIAGTYTGETFEAETYDVQVDGDGTNTTVEAGACVVTEISPDFGPLYLFVEADDGWHRLLESDPGVPLLPDPETQLEDVEQIQAEEITG